MVRIIIVTPRHQTIEERTFPSHASAREFIDSISPNGDVDSRDLKLAICLNETKQISISLKQFYICLRDQTGEEGGWRLLKDGEVDMKNTGLGVTVFAGGVGSMISNCPLSVDTMAKFIHVHGPRRTDIEVLAIGSDADWQSPVTVECAERP